MDLFREKHTPQTECGPSEKIGTALNCGMVSFYGLGNSIDYWVGGLLQLFWGGGENFQELGHCLLFAAGQLLSHVRLFATPWTAACSPSLSFTSPRACSNSCPLSQWCRPTTSSSVIAFPSCLLSFPTSGSFPGSRLFASGGQSIGASASTSVLRMNIQGWFPLGLSGLISLQSKGLSKVFSNIFISVNSLALSLLYGPTLTSMCEYWKNHSFDYMDLYWQSDVSAF